MSKKIMQFQSLSQFFDWQDNEAEVNDAPILIMNDWEIRADMLADCKKASEAVKNFCSTFNKMAPEVTEFMAFDDIDSLCDNLRRSYHDSSISSLWDAKEQVERTKAGCFSLGVEQVGEDCWYVFVNCSGIYRQ